MKYLVRSKNGFGKGAFLEAKLEENKFIPLENKCCFQTGDLFHFGTDIINSSDLKKYSEKMEKEGVDYLFVSPNEELVNNMQHKVYNGSSLTSKTMVAVTSYIQKNFY